jgi:hypothetical protein
MLLQRHEGRRFVLAHQPPEAIDFRRQDRRQLQLHRSAFITRTVASFPQLRACMAR